MWNREALKKLGTEIEIERGREICLCVCVCSLCLVREGGEIEQLSGDQTHPHYKPFFHLTLPLFSPMYKLSHLLHVHHKMLHESHPYIRQSGPLRKTKVARRRLVAPATLIPERYFILNTQHKLDKRANTTTT